jgi:hypothetical protein
MAGSLLNGISNFQHDFSLIKTQHHMFTTGKGWPAKGF